MFVLSNIFFQVHLSYAEAFVINENGMVVGFEHCKTKSFEDLKPSLERIWSVQSPTIKTSVVWTDNVHADAALLRKCYKEYRPEADLQVGQVCTVFSILPFNEVEVI